MTLATRCPTCGTVFRVVQDQLRVSQGWVRCGRCSAAFNARESMVEVPTALTPEPVSRPDNEPFPATDFGPTAVMEWPETAPAADIAAPAPTPSREHAGPATRAAAPAVDDEAYVLDDVPLASDPRGTLLDLPIGMKLIASDGALAPAAPSNTLHQRTEPVYSVEDEANDPVDLLDGHAAAADPGAEPFMVLAQSTAQSSAQSSTRIGQGFAPPAPDSQGALADVPDRAPSFLVKAERAERWRRPAVRFVLALMAVVGIGGLGAQVAHAFRDRIVAAVPALRPVLQQACNVLGCVIAEFRQIESLSVESSGLVRVEGAPVYRLTVTLRNRAALEVAAPALDLALTDAQGKPIARRVLQMSDLYLPLRSLKAGSELPIQVSLSIGERPVSGYTVEIFYP